MKVHFDKIINAPGYGISERELRKFLTALPPELTAQIKAVHVTNTLVPGATWIDHQTGTLTVYARGRTRAHIVAGIVPELLLHRLDYKRYHYQSPSKPHAKEVAQLAAPLIEQALATLPLPKPNPPLPSSCTCTLGVGPPQSRKLNAMTIFQRIAAREIPADIVYEEDDFFAFRDVNPQAPVHVLIVPKQVIVRLGETTADDAPLLGRMLAATRAIAEKLGVLESGYRIVINSGRDAGESVPHLHLHLLAARPLQWPPG